VAIAFSERHGSESLLFSHTRAWLLESVDLVHMSNDLQPLPSRFGEEREVGGR
jgi:hypothetical protein